MKRLAKRLKRLSYELLQEQEPRTMITEDRSQNPVRAAIVGWEKLRIIFNVLQLALGLLLTWDLHPNFGGIHVYAFLAAIYGITANAFYCLGPLLEIYSLTFAPARVQPSRITTFVVGTVFSLIVTAILAARMCLISRGFPHGV